MQEATMEFIAKQPKQRQELDTPAIGGKRQPVPAVGPLFRTSFDLQWDAHRPAISYWGNRRQLKDHSVLPLTIIFA
jgi:hypothetical protein